MASSSPQDTPSHHSVTSPSSPHDASTPTTEKTPNNHRKHFKVSRACDPCKTKKIRCSGTLPCQTCSRRSLTCTYATRYGRGRPPTPPSMAGRRSLESVKTGDDSAFHSNTPLTNRREEESEPRGASELVIEGQYVDLTSGLNFLHRAWSKLSAQRGQLLAHGSDKIKRNQLLESAGDQPFYVNQTGIDVLSNDGSERELVKFYFDSCVVTYRMLHRQTVEGWLGIMLQNRAQGHPLTLSLDNASASIVLTIFAIATFRRIKLNRALPDDIHSAGLHESDPIFHAATELTDSETGFPRVESAQARLLQVLYLLQTGRMSKAWYTFGNAYQIISSLGLHRKQVRYKGASGDYIAQQCAKRVFWTAYTIDKYLSVVFGRPRLLHDVEIDQDFPDLINDEDMESAASIVSEAGDECHVLSLMCHAQISQLIGRVSHQVYYAGDGQGNRAAAADALIFELKQWHADLPPHLGTVKPSTLVPSFRREATAINLAYYHALIHVTRPFLLGDGNTFSDEPSMQARVSECLSAARKAVEIIQRIANDNELAHSFWWSQYVLFCALAVIYVWEIQRKQCHDARAGDESHKSLFDLAETSRSYLQSTGSSAPPNYRYGLILDELRLEAHRQDVNEDQNGNVPESSQTVEHTLGINLDYESAGLDMATNPILLSGSRMLESWQTTDWLDLDSSAFYPVPDMSDILP